MGAIENIQKAREKSMSPEFKLPKSIQERVDNVEISGIREKGISAQELDEYISKGDRLEDIIVRRKGEDPGFTIPERKWGDPGMVIPERRWERDPEHMKKLYELFMERKFGPNWRVRKRHPERMKFGPEQRHPEEMTFEEMPRGDREAPPVSSGWLAKGGRVGLALGGDPYMEDYRDKSLEDPILEPGDEMMPDDAQGIVSQLTNEQDPEKKIMLAIQIIQSMGDRGIEIVESVLSPEEIAMAAQVIQQMGAAEGGIDNVQMAAEGGRIGLRGGGGDLEMRRMEAAAQRRRLGREGKHKDTADMYSWLSTADPTYREESFRDPMWQQWWADPENIGAGSPHGDVEAWKKSVIESGDPRGLFSGKITDTKYRSPEEIAASKRYLDHYNRMASVLGMDPSSIASGAESQLTSEVAPWAEPAPTPMPTPPGPTPTVEAAPVMTTPAVVPAATGAAPVLESLNPMTYQTSYETPTVADPTTNMSQYYSDALSTPYFDFQSSNTPAADTAANVAAQYLNPQDAQLYQGAANGGRIGFDNGGSPDDYLLEPGAAQTDPEELIQEIEAQGGLQTAQSTMGNMLMKAMEDSHWMEIGSWLDQYSGFGLGEEDYFNFRTMGPQVKGPEATEGLASVRV